MSDGAVIVVRTGVANLASVVAGLRRVGLRATVTDDASRIASAERLVLPGVGSFGAAMAELERHDLIETLVERIASGRPTLAICLGLQLLGGGSEETPGCRGLGVFDECAARFDAGVRVPQLGWNRVRPDSGCAWVRPGYAYFANSYRLRACPPGWRAAWADHGGLFIAALERDGVLACQFHPELSGDWGRELLERWATSAATPGIAC